jgi:Flp pilus assembly protein TadD
MGGGDESSNPKFQSSKLGKGTDVTGGGRQFQAGIWNSPGRGWFGAALVLFALGLMSKPMLVTTPFVLLLLDYWPLRRFEPKTEASNLRGIGSLAWEKFPFFVLAAASSIVTFLVQQHGGAVAEIGAVSLEHRIANALVSYVVYIKNMFWPNVLALCYPLPPSIPLWMSGGAFLVLVLLSALALRQARRRPYLTMGWCWYLGTLVPVIGLVQVGVQSMADRYTYIPLVGLFVALTWAVVEWAGLEKTGDARKKWATPVLATIALTILGVCSVLTVHQVRFWKDSETLFRHSLAVTGPNPIMQASLGAALLDERKLDEAAEHLEEALRLKPDYAEALSNLGLALALQGRLDEAVANYRQSLEIKPNKVRVHYTLGLALQMQGKREEAIAEFRKALEIDPDWSPALNDLAWFLATSRDPAQRNGMEAVEFGERACRLTSYESPLMIGTLAAAYAEAGRFDDAVRTAERACDTAAKIGQPNLVKRNKELLELYRVGQAYHEGEK